MNNFKEQVLSAQELIRSGNWFLGGKLVSEIKSYPAGVELIVGGEERFIRGVEAVLLEGFPSPSNIIFRTRVVTRKTSHDCCEDTVTLIKVL